MGCFDGRTSFLSALAVALSIADVRFQKPTQPREWLAVPEEWRALLLIRTSCLDLSRLPLFPMVSTIPLAADESIFATSRIGAFGIILGDPFLFDWRSNCFFGARFGTWFLARATRFRAGLFTFATRFGSGLQPPLAAGLGAGFFANALTLERYELF